MAAGGHKSNWTDPDIYETFMGRWSERLASLFIASVELARNAHVLDVGCGTGVLAKALADTGRSVVGVDASDGYLRGARERRSHPRVSYEHGDVRSLRFADNEFDAAVSSLVLDLIPEIEDVVTEMKRVTRPGGVVASAVTQFLGGMPAFDLVINTGAAFQPSFARLRDMRTGNSSFWPGGQAALWTRVGLVDVSEVPVVVDCDYASFEDYWSTFSKGRPGLTAPALQELPEEARSEIERHVRSGYLLGHPDGPRSLPLVVRIVSGRVPP
jgi:SAM-dependent methyltransferase